MAEWLWDSPGLAQLRKALSGQQRPATSLWGIRPATIAAGPAPSRPMRRRSSAFWEDLTGPRRPVRWVGGKHDLFLGSQDDRRGHGCE